MNKFKLFIENFLVYGMGGIISKIIPLVMVPIVTRLMPDSSYYGISDLSNTLSSFGSAFAIMGMYDAMYRMFFEKDDNQLKRRVCSTALSFTLFTSVVVFLVMILCRDAIARFFFNDANLAYVVYISAMATLVGATNNIISAPIRMQNKRKVYLIANTVSPLLSYSVALFLLNRGYYTIALPLAAVISGFSVEIVFALMNRKWFSLKLFDICLLKQLLFIAVPLLPNFLIYWVFNSCDKVMITNMIGIGAAGIYSVGSKLGHCSQLIYTAFAGGWQYFAFSTMKDKDQVKSNSSIFEYLGVISFVATSFICAWSFWIFKILFNEQYLEGFIIAPYLFLAPLLQMLFQVACNQFLIVKKTWPNMLILSCGALVNVVANYLLIPILGIEGASIATLFGYIISVIICVLVLCKMRLMVKSYRFMLATGVMMLFMIVWRLMYSQNGIVGTCLACLITIIMVLLYWKEINGILKVIKKSNKEIK